MLQQLILYKHKMQYFFDRIANFDSKHKTEVRSCAITLKTRLITCTCLSSFRETFVLFEYFLLINKSRDDNEPYCYFLACLASKRIILSKKINKK